MNKHDIKVVLDNLYNEGKITLKEKTRIGDLSLEEAIKVDQIKEEFGLKNAVSISVKDNTNISESDNTVISASETDSQLLREILQTLKSIESSNGIIKGYMTFFGVLSIISILIWLIALVSLS